MSEKQPDQNQKARAVRIERPFTVRVNEGLSSGQDRWEVVIAKNLSASGILFNYNRRFKLGTQLRFRISLPVCDSIECDGKIVRCEMSSFGKFKNSEPAVSAVAAVFENLSAKDHDLLEEFLAQNDADASKDKAAKMLRAKRIERSFPFWMRQEGQPNWTPVSMRNISASGVLMTCQKMMDVGETFSLRLVFPFTSSPIKCKGCVMRVDDKTLPGSSLKFINIGVKFFDMDEDVKRQLSEYAETLNGA